jgi:cytochrome c-type biogenesis protein CcmH/NrfG
MGLNDVMSWIQLADSAFHNGQQALARQALEQGLALKPGHPAIMSRLMQVQLQHLSLQKY